MIVSQCEKCVWIRQTESRCAAFPDGIPPEIRLNKHDHKKPYKGDNGIQFEPLENA